MKYSVRNFFLVFLMSIVIFSVIAVFVVRYADSAMEHALAGEDGSGEGVEVGKITEDIPTVLPEQKNSDTVTFLLCGTDETDGWADGMILVRIDREKSLYTVVSIPANMRLFVGGSDRAVGSLCSLESHNFIKQKISAVTGIPVDYYVGMDFQGFSDLIDLVGGVDYNVPQNMYYRDDAQALKIDLKSGVQKLDGAKAIQLVRFMGYANGVEGRNQTQLDFFVTFAQSVFRADNMFKAQSAASKIFETVDTDMTVSDFISVLPLIFSYDSFEKEAFSYPGRYALEGGREWFIPSLDAAFTVFEAYR